MQLAAGERDLRDTTDDVKAEGPTIDEAMLQKAAAKKAADYAKETEHSAEVISDSAMKLSLKEELEAGVLVDITDND